MLERYANHRNVSTFDYSQNIYYRSTYAQYQTYETAQFIMAESVKRQAFASSDEGSPPKKSSNRPFTHLLEEVDKNGHLSEIKKCLLSLCQDKCFALVAKEIIHCDAGAGYGIPFTSAYCQTKEHPDEFYPFASVFRKGMRYLQEIMKNRDHIPEDDTIIQPVKRLLHYFSQKDHDNFLVGLFGTDKKKNVVNEMRLAVAFTEHMFSKLASPSYILDNHSPSLNYVCVCGCNTNLLDKAGNTSIGNELTWHGYLDILVGVDGVPITVGCRESSPGGKTPIEVKYDTDIEDMEAQQQIIAQTIVFSFLQKKRHPDYKHFLIPSVFISEEKIMFFFYDSEKDILMRTPPIELMKGNKLSYYAVVALWFVLNYKTLGSGIPETVSVPKANFFEHAKDSLIVYQNFLTFGNVNKSANKPRLIHPPYCPDARFNPEHFTFE